MLGRGRLRRQHRRPSQRQAGDFTFGAGFTDHDDGVSAGLSVTPRLPLGLGFEGLQRSAGASGGFGGDDLSSVSLGLTAAPRAHGFRQLLPAGNVGTIHRSHFLGVQPGFDEPAPTLALSRGGSTE